MHRQRFVTAAVGGRDKTRLLVHTGGVGGGGTSLSPCDISTLESQAVFLGLMQQIDSGMTGCVATPDDRVPSFADIDPRVVVK